MKYDSLRANYKVISIRKANRTQCLNLASRENKLDQVFSRITCSLVREHNIDWTAWFIPEFQHRKG